MLWLDLTPSWWSNAWASWVDINAAERGRLALVARVVWDGVDVDAVLCCRAGGCFATHFIAYDDSILILERYVHREVRADALRAAMLESIEALACETDVGTTPGPRFDVEVAPDYMAVTVAALPSGATMHLYCDAADGDDAITIFSDVARVLTEMSRQR